MSPPTAKQTSPPNHPYSKGIAIKKTFQTQRSESDSHTSSWPFDSAIAVATNLQVVDTTKLCFTHPGHSFLSIARKNTNIKGHTQAKMWQMCGRKKMHQQATFQYHKETQQSLNETQFCPKPCNKEYTEILAVQLADLILHGQSKNQSMDCCNNLLARALAPTKQPPLPPTVPLPT